MFKKRQKENSVVYLIDDSRVVVHDFKLRRAFASYSPIDYRVYSKFTDEVMIPILNDRIEALSNHVDDGNGNCVDSLLYSIGLEALQDLCLQRASHLDMTRKLIVRFNSDRRDIDEELKLVQAELAKLQSDYSQVLEKIKIVEVHK